MLQFQPEQLRGYFAGYVVGRRPETTGDENDVRLIQRFSDCMPDGLAVGHGELPIDAKSERENFPGNEGEMGIQHVTEENLGSGVDDDYAHDRPKVVKERRFTN